MSEIRNPSAPPPTGPTAPDASAQPAMTSLPHANIDAHAVNRQVTAIFEQAGLVRGPDGSLQVQDTAPLGKSTEVKGLANFEQVYGTGESQLKPPAPPQVQLTEAGRVGAETFAASMDRVIDDILVRPKTQQAFSSKPEANTSPARAPAESRVAAAEKATSEATAAQKAAQTTTTGSTKSLWKLAQEIQQSPAAQQYRAAMAGNTAPASASSAQLESYRRMTDLTADILLAAFLKLNIMDPNNSVETHQRLYTVMSKLRQRAIADAKQKMKVAEELRKEAEKEADSAAYVSNLMTAIRIIVCLVALVCTVVLGPLAFILIAAALVCCAATIVEAKANNEAQVAASDAAQSGTMAKRAYLMADRAQEQLEEEAEMIKVIIESKNEMVESVMNMLNAMFGANQKLMSAGMAKG